MRGLFVTGTDTGVGKSVLAAAICAGLAERGRRVAAFKPVVTKVQPKGYADAVTDVNTSDDYKVYFVKADEKGQPTDEVVAEPIEAGDYCDVVEAVSRLIGVGLLAFGHDLNRRAEA